MFIHPQTLIGIAIRDQQGTTRLQPGENGYKARRTGPDRLNPRAADLRLKIITKLETNQPTLPKLSDKVPSGDLLEDVTATLQTISTGSNAETNKLIYSTAVGILEMH